MKKQKLAKFLKIFFVAFFLLSAVTAIFFYQGFYIPKDSYGEEIFFSVKTGEKLSEIAHNLEKEGIIKKDYFFIIYGVITEKSRTLKPGNYSLSPSMSVSQVLRKISEGNAEKITIVEGWTLRDIAELLESKGYGQKEDFYQLAGKPPYYEDGEVFPQRAGEMERELGLFEDKPGNLPLEGYLFPDTYFISPGTPMEEIINTFLFNFKQKITPEIKEKMEERGMSLFETVTLASLIEKEVITVEDKRLVSGIIQKRLEDDFPLQIDATVTYLTRKRSVDVSIAETKIDSPYNTYMNLGLPEGPICNPGMESIKAALNPQESDYYYYLSKPTGETVFSRTHEEHVEAKNKYLRNNN